MSQTGMRQRCWEHDYCAPCFYLITVVTEPRRECLGTLKEDATIELSPVGEMVRAIWRRTSEVYRAAEGCECVVMPDHFHGILWVKERLARPMGHIVKAFKRVSTQECRSRGLLLPPSRPYKGLVLPPVLWQEGFQDSILLRRGQLKAMVDYIADNPRRLAVKRANPELFTVVTRQELSPDRSCAMIGNRLLLDHPLKRQIQISRRISAEALAQEREELLYAAEHGAVLVSPCISPGEKEVARAVMDAGRPLIVLLDNGFPPCYKPPGRYFDACAEGRLLMLAPLPYHRWRRTITREQCLALNEWAAAVVECSPAARGCRRN